MFSTTPPTRTPPRSNIFAPRKLSPTAISCGVVAIIVTTPQEMAVGDSLRGAKMFERGGVRVGGVVENMSFYVCPHCGEGRSEGRRGGKECSSGGQRKLDK